MNRAKLFKHIIFNICGNILPIWHCGARQGVHFVCSIDHNYDKYCINSEEHVAHCLQGERLIHVAHNGFAVERKPVLTGLVPLLLGNVCLLLASRGNRLDYRGSGLARVGEGFACRGSRLAGLHIH